MKRIGLLMLSLFTLLLVVGCNKATEEEKQNNNESNNQQQKPEAEIQDLNTTIGNYIDSLLSATDDYVPSWNRESFKGRWNYIDGVFLNSIVNLYYNLKDTNPTKANSYKDFFIKYINYYIDENGVFVHPETKEANFRTGELDSICESKILFDAYQMTNDQRYLNAIESTYTYLKAMDIVDGSYGNYSHKSNYLDQIWLDGMYMYVPFNARYAVYKNDATELSKIKKQYQFIRENMYDEAKKLYYHGYSSKGIFWSGNKPGTSPSFWLRSMGWYIVSLVDVLEYYPEGNDKEYLKGLLQEAIEGLLQYQDQDTKMFYQVIDKGPIEVLVPASYLEGLKNAKYLTSDGYVDTKIKNYVESSGSSMIAYTLMKGAKLGYLDSSYQQKGQEIFEGIYNHSYQNKRLTNICVTAGLGPESNELRDGSIYYYLAEPVGTNDAKGVGPFLMAYLEYAYEKTAQAPTLISNFYTVEFYADDNLFRKALVVKNEAITMTDIPVKVGYDFDGWQIDGADYDFSKKVTQNLILTAKWKKKLSYYEKINAMNSLVYSNNFDSYSGEAKLSDFTTWGTQGVYSRYNDKENDQEVDLSKNYIVLGNGYAHLKDLSNDGIQIYTDLSNTKSSINKAYLACSICMPKSTTPWTPFQMYGTSTANSNISEVLGITINNKNLSFGYRFDGASSSNKATSVLSNDNVWYEIYIEINYNTKQLLVKVNDEIIYEGSTTINSIAGFRVVSRDNLEFDIMVDNIAYAIE